MKYVVIAHVELRYCDPNDHVSFDSWTHAEACGIAAALNTGAVKEDDSLSGVYFCKPDDYRFGSGYGIKRLET